MPNIIDNEELFNVIVLGGTSSPGQVTLSGHDSKVEWDVKVAQATKGATTTIKAIPPPEFTASFYLVKDDSQGINDFDAWDPFQALIDSTVASKTPKALDIYHPDLARNGITSVVKASVGGMTYDGKGGGTVVVKFQVYAPPKPQGGTPSGSSKGTNPNDPNAAAKAELQNLLNQYQATPWG